jgi:ParB family chromosome partitioning protein
MSKTVSRGLGKGFGSLLPQDFDQSMLLDKQDRIQKVPLTKIQPDPDQPRRTFDDGLIDELAQSIKRYGILQPLVVTERDDNYFIVAGERRFRAAAKAGLTAVPVLVRTLEELERLEISLVENVQRVDLNPVEQALSVARLHEQFNMSYQEIAKRLGKAHTTIANIVRLLGLPDFARTALVEGRITEGHARQVLALKTEDLQKELVQHIEQDGWSVRQAEQFVSENRLRPEKKTVGRPAAPAYSDVKLNKSLSTKWGFKVTVLQKPTGGKVTINIDSREQLDEFIAFLDNKS